MQASEKRLIPRIQLGQVPQGAVSLILHGQRIEVTRLRDISNTGISFSVGRPVDASENISLIYADPKIKLEVFGRVAWCKQSRGLEAANAPQVDIPPDHYVMGVELLSPMMLYAVLPRA